MDYFRNPNIALGVAAVLMVLGWLAVGRDPTDAEIQIIYFSAMAVAMVVLLRLEALDHRRNRRH